MSGCASNQLLIDVQNEQIPEEEDVDMMAGIKSDAVGSHSCYPLSRQTTSNSSVQWRIRLILDSYVFLESHQGYL